VSKRQYVRTTSPFSVLLLASRSHILDTTLREWERGGDGTGGIDVVRRISCSNFYAKLT